MSAANVIDLSEHRSERERRQRCLRRIEGQLEDVLETLWAATLNAACAGPWRDWDRDQPRGTKIEIDREMFMATGDPLVIAMLESVDAVSEVVALVSDEAWETFPSSPGYEKI